MSDVTSKDVLQGGLGCAHSGVLCLFLLEQCYIFRSVAVACAIVLAL